MFFNKNYIPAVPIREEQRISEEEELARQLKREARIFFPDRKLPDFDTVDLPPLPTEEQEPELWKTSPSPGGEEQTTVLQDHDAVCREEDSLRREPDGSISHHEVEDVRQESEQIVKKRKQLQNSRQSLSQLADGEIGLQTGGTGQDVRPRLNKQDVKRGIRLQVILDKPRGITPWKEDKF